MPRPYLGDPKYTIEVLQKYNFAFQKRFGQNFLIDTHVLDKIIDSAQITKDDFVLEIGPGIGTMTQYLAEAAREVAAVEIDKTLLPILDDTLKDWDNVTVINNDILKVEIQIRTVAQDFWATLEHKMHYKFEGDGPDYITKELRECARYVAELDTRMEELNNEIQKYGKLSDKK